MQVRVGASLSDYNDQEQGVPQGGVLSTTLFSIKINDIVKCLENLMIAHYTLTTSVSVIARKAWQQLNVNYNKI